MHKAIWISDPVLRQKVQNLHQGWIATEKLVHLKKKKTSNDFSNKENNNKT